MKIYCRKEGRTAQRPTRYVRFNGPYQTYINSGAMTHLKLGKGKRKRVLFGEEDGILHIGVVPVKDNKYFQKGWSVSPHKNFNTATTGLDPQLLDTFGRSKFEVGQDVSRSKESPHIQWFELKKK